MSGSQNSQEKRIISELISTFTDEDGGTCRVFQRVCEDHADQDVRRYNADDLLPNGLGYKCGCGMRWERSQTIQ